jgi:hypothetical protein
MVLSGTARAQGFAATTVQGTVYLANGHPGSGSLQVSWPAFTTASNQAVTAGRMSVTIGADGYVSVNLAANLGATPAGLYYTAVYHLSDGTTSTEYWVVPAAGQASLSQVRAQVMPAAQAVQAVSKAYVDQSVQELTQSLLTASGGSLSGPLFLNSDPTQPTQAANKRYVDAEFGQAVPMSGAALTGPLTSVQLGAAYQVDQFPGADFGAKLQACVNVLNPTYGGTCDGRNFSGNLAISSDLILGKANATVQLPCATISTSNQIKIPAGTRNVTIHGCAMRGASASSGSAGGTVLLYSGTAAMMQVGDPTYGVDTSGFHIDNAVINTTGSTSSTAEGLAAYRTQEMNLASLYFLGNSNQTGVTLDGTGNYTGGTFQDVELGGFGTAVNAIGHQTANAMITDWTNASTFLRLHIDCPTNGGTPIAGTYGINLQQGDGNTFTGGDVEGCSTALHLGPNAQNNTIVGLRTENSINQVVADAGSSYNNWVGGGTMFTGQLTDNGTRNSFLDTFHRSFNGLNGDWYGSQQDATVTNHFRLGTGNGKERGLLNRYQTDFGYRWTTGFSDATAGEQFYQVLDELNNVYRLSIGQYNNGQSSSNNQTVINAAGSGAVVLNGSSNSRTGGVVFGSGGSNAATVGSINNSGNAQFNGTLQVGGPSTFSNSTTVKNQVDAEIDSFLWAGATANQKESYTYKDYAGASQWYMVKDASNNWALNSAPGGLDSFKAYQSTNSGDTYVNASNAAGHIRLNYETGSGAETDIYSGSSSGLVAAFLGSTAIKFPGLAAANGHNCLQIDNSGYISNSGSSCGTSLNGTVNAGNTGQVAYYTGNGNVIAGTNAVAVNAGGTGASNASQALQNLGAQPVLTGIASDGASGIAVGGNVAATSTASSVNNVLYVKAAPYNAKCDGTTDDQTAIQSAFDDAGSTKSVQFPAGTCLTSTITWKGQSFYGAGVQLTTILGKPGQDVFQGPQPFNYPSFVTIHDIQIKVDASVNAAATAVGGNNTFPNRISGTYSGTTPIPANLGGPPAPGPLMFSTSIPGGCGLNATATTTTVTVSCARFDNAPMLNGVAKGTLIGQPITITGAGSSGGTYTGTITAYISSTQLTVSPAISTTVSGASATMGTPITAPWYFGNCGLTVPQDTQDTVGGVNGWKFHNVWFTSNGGNPQNYTCGILLTAQANQMMFDNVTFSHLWGGMIEYPPATVTNWGYLTNDTASYKDVNFEFNLIPFVWYAGNHRVANSISIYTGFSPFYMGPWMFQNTTLSAKFTSFYHECWGYNSGELERFSGTFSIDSGSTLSQCAVTNLYANFVGNDTVSDAHVGNLHINGNHNTFRSTLASGSSAVQILVDNGLDNKVEGSGGAVARSVYYNQPKNTAREFDSGFLLTGNSSTPFLSGKDLVSYCPEFNFAFAAGLGAPGCTSNLNDSGSPAPSYVHMLTSVYTTGWNRASVNGSQGQSSLPWTVGGSGVLPKGPGNLIVQARCDVQCTAQISVYDVTGGNTQLATSTATYQTSWTIQKVHVDLSSAAPGDAINIVGGATGGGASYMDLALIAFEPDNVDTINAAATSPLVQGAIMGNMASGNLLMYPCSMGFSGPGGSLSCRTDANSPYTNQDMVFPTTQSSYTAIASYNGANLTIGNQIKALLYTVTITGYASAGWTQAIAVLCGSTTIYTINIPWTTTYTNAQNPYQFNVDFSNAACTAGAAVKFQFNPVTNTTYMGSLALNPSSCMTATTSMPGCVKPDGTTITISGGVLSSAGSYTGAVPSWLQFYGDGSEGALNCPSGICASIPVGEHWYSTCNIAAGATQPFSGTSAGTPIILRCATSATIAGTLGGTPNVNSVANGGGGGGGGGGGAAAGAAGTNSWGNSGGGTAGTASGGAAGNGSLTITAAQQKLYASNFWTFYSVGSTASFAQCGGSPGGAGGSTGGAAGKAGQCLIIVSPSINFTGTVDMSGGAGGASTGNSVGPGGGGGGGIVIMRSPNFTNGGTINVNGGAAGSCGAFTTCGAGGAGAAGWSRVFTQ